MLFLLLRFTPVKMPPPATTPEPVLISLAVRLHEDANLRDAALAVLKTRPDLQLGTLHERWLPLVAETFSPLELHAWVESLPGVLAVEVAFVEVTPTPESSPSAAD